MLQREGARSAKSPKSGSGHRGDEPAVCYQGLGPLKGLERALSKEQGRNCRKACDYMPMSFHPQDEALGRRHVIVQKNDLAAPLAVIDTNVVLDIWWFGDARAASLAQALAHGALRWCATQAMRAELVDVLKRPRFSTKADSCKSALASFDRLTHSVPWEHPSAAPLCSDPDDQLFIDLAFGCRARWLFTRDNALLALARKARRWHCEVATPQQWATLAPSGPPPTSAACPVL